MEPAAPRWMSRILYHYPFTLSGTALFIIAVVMLGKSYTTGNPYGLMLALFAFSALCILSLGGRLQASRIGGIQVQWDTTRPLYAGVEGSRQQLLINGIRPLSFYRLHFKVSGNMKVGRDAYLYVSREASSAGGESLEIPIFLSLTGELDARGSLSLRDVFGLTRARFGPDFRRKLLVQPGPFANATSYHIEAIGGFEEKHRQKSAEEERYFMREYIPGDRYRDINWKSSSRLLQLITKISPFTQEKTRLIPVEFRHFRKDGRETAESVAHLNQLKSWLLSFLRTVKQENPDYHFLIKTGNGAFRIERDEDIDRFSLELSSIFFQPEPADSQADTGAGELFIFSTPYDENLPTVLASYSRASLHVFITTPPGVSGRKPKIVYIFPSTRAFALPDLWVIRRERRLRKPEIGVLEKGRFEEHPIEVKILGRGD